MHKEAIAKAGEIILKNTVCNAPEGSERYCVLALIDANGYPTASTITAAKADGISRIYFCTGLSSNKVDRIKKCGRASVCFCSPAYNITLVGAIEILTDAKIKKEMWYDGLAHHFSGDDDPGYCVLRFSTERYNFFIDWQETAGTL